MDKQHKIVGVAASDRERDGTQEEGNPAQIVQAGKQFGWDLPRAIATVTANPARVAGLRDRGRIAAGQRADLVHVRMAGERPVVKGVWRAGARVY